MDMNLVAAAFSMRAANVQSQVATRVLKMNLDAQAQVLQLLAPTQNAPATSNPSGVGAWLDTLA